MIAVLGAALFLLLIYLLRGVLQLEGDRYQERMAQRTSPLEALLDSIEAEQAQMAVTAGSDTDAA